jgi:hypothetical protein
MQALLNTTVFNFLQFQCGLTATQTNEEHILPMYMNSPVVLSKGTVMYKLYVVYDSHIHLSQYQHVSYCPNTNPHFVHHPRPAVFLPI